MKPANHDIFRGIAVYSSWLNILRTGKRKRHRPKNSNDWKFKSQPNLIRQILVQKTLPKTTPESPGR